MSGLYLRGAPRMHPQGREVSQRGARYRCKHKEVTVGGVSNLFLLGTWGKEGLFESGVSFFCVFWYFKRYGTQSHPFISYCLHCFPGAGVESSCWGAVCVALKMQNIDYQAFYGKSLPASDLDAESKTIIELRFGDSFGMKTQGLRRSEDQWVQRPSLPPGLRGRSGAPCLDLD